MKPAVALVGRLPEGYPERLHRHYTLHPFAALRDDAALRKTITALIAAGPTDAAMMDELPALRYILNLGVGYEQVDTAAAEARGLMMTNSAGVGADSVADAAIGLLLAISRRLVEGDRFVRQKKWGQADFALSAPVSGRRIGVLGFGNIGRLVARRAAGFDMEIGYCARHPRRDCPYAYFETPLALAAFADYLVVTVPGGDATRGLVDRAVLDALGPDGYLVNVGRGSVIDEEALIAALEQGRIAGAGLDVFADEPHVPERLLACNVVVTPHRAGSTTRSLEDGSAFVLDNLAAFFAGRPLKARVL